MGATAAATKIRITRGSCSSEWAILLVFVCFSVEGSGFDLVTSHLGVGSHPRRGRGVGWREGRVSPSPKGGRLNLGGTLNLLLMVLCTWPTTHTRI